MVKSRAKRWLALSGIAVLLLLLSTAVLYKLYGGIEYDRNVRARADITGLQTQLEVYREENGFYPTTEQGLQALVAEPQSSPIPQHWYQHCHSLLMDSWRHPYVYRFPAPTDPSTFDLFSLGPDGVESGDDMRGSH